MVTYFIYICYFSGHGWGAADEGHIGGHDSPVSFEGGEGGSYGVSAGDSYGHDY